MYDLSVEYFQFQQGTQSVTDYFATFNSLYEEMNTILPMTIDLKEMQKQREQMAVMKFLAGLRPELEPVRSIYPNVFFCRLIFG